MAAVVLPLGLRLSIEGEASETLEAVKKMFSLCECSEGSADVRLEVYASQNGDKYEMLPEWVSDKLSALEPVEKVVTLYGGGGDVATLFKGEGFFSCGWMSANGERICFVSRKKAFARAPLSCQFVLLPILREAILPRGGVLLHGAAVACPNGVGVLLLGEGGAGKTSTSLALVRKGAKLLSDDLVVLRAGSEGITGYGFLKLLNLTRETIGFFDELRALQEGCDFSVVQRRGAKLAFRPEQLYGEDCLADHCAIGVMYFLDVSVAGPSLEAISSSEALGRLMRSHTFAEGQRLAGMSADMLCAILGNVQRYVLHTGDDPKLLGDWLIEHCAKHCNNGVVGGG